MFTYQNKKIVALNLLALIFWLIILMLKVDVDKGLTEIDKLEAPLESVTEQQTSCEIKNGIEVLQEWKESANTVYEMEWSYEDSYLLAKIAMVEAGGETMYGKVLVVMTILNRVQSDSFPDTIEEVIMQEQGGVYQFSPVAPGGSWWTTEPNEECWEAVRLAQEAVFDYSEGSLYFESCENEDNWHSRNLEFLYQEGNHRFYR